MRKLSILMFILVLASAASALTVSLSLDGVNPAPAPASVGVEPGETFTLYIICDSGGPTANYWSYLDTNLPVAATMPAVGQFTIYPAAGNMAGLVDYSTASLYDMEFTAADTGGNVAAGLHFSAPITIDSDAATDGSDDFSIWTTKPNDPLYATDDTLAVYIIPEPMTIALLGFGGLLLRRHR